MNLAGKPTQVVGAAARIAGWTVLLVGLTAALLLGTLLQSIFPAAVLGWVLGITLGILAVACGVLLLRGGRHLRATGATHADAERARALRAFAASHGGIVRATDAARVLDLSVEAADGVMMGLARRGNASIEYDERGAVSYRIDASMMSDAALTSPTSSDVRVDPFVERLRVQAADPRDDEDLGTRWEEPHRPSHAAR